MTNLSRVLDIHEDPDTGDFYLELTDEILQEAGWQEGDTLEWIDNNDGSWTLKKL